MEKNEELREVPKMLAKMCGMMRQTGEFQGSVEDYADMIFELAVLIEAMHDKIEVLEKKLAQAERIKNQLHPAWGVGDVFSGVLHT